MSLQGASASLAEFAGKTVHAVAGIGHPERFFSLLRSLGMNVLSHEYPDHHVFLAKDVRFGDSYPVIMTEKDAVKCMKIATDNVWYLKVTAEPNECFRNGLLAKLSKMESEYANKNRVEKSSNSLRI